MKAHLDERKLLKELSEQGFDVSSTRDGYKVTSPTGTTSFHSSSLEAAPGIYQQVVSKLKRIGFKEPDEFKKQRLVAGREKRHAKEEAERAAGPYVCEDCGHESPFKRNLARHQQAARHGEYQDRPILAPQKAVKPAKKVPEELKAKRLVRKLKEQIAAVNQTCDELITLIEPMEKANHEMRGKLQRLEGVVGKLVEEI